MTYDKDLFNSYKRKMRNKKYDLVTRSEREANRDYYRDYRDNMTEEQKQAAELSWARSDLKSKMKKQAEAEARRDLVELIEHKFKLPKGFDTDEFGDEYDR